MDSDPTTALALGDVDGDGDLDLVLANGALRTSIRCGSYIGKYCAQWAGKYTGQQNRLYLNDGTGTFTDVTASRIPVDSMGSTGVALGDIDSDGDLDITFSNGPRYGAPTAMLYVNDGSGTFADVTATQTVSGTQGNGDVAFCDIDADGDIDMVLSSQQDVNRLMLNDGTGRFTDVTSTRAPDTTGSSLALGDVDRDGDPDIVFDGNRLYNNLLRQIHASVQPRISLNYQIDVYARYGPPSAADVAVLCISGGPASMPFPPFGVIGIDASQMIVLPHRTVPQPAGVGSATIAVPNDPNLVGVAVYVQALLVQDPFRAHLTNVIHNGVGW
jgi:hypothetical protein